MNNTDLLQEKCLIIYYASQTGVCKHLAVETCKYLSLRNYKVECFSTASVLISNFIYTNPLILIISTHGDGDFNYSFAKIWTFLTYPHDKKIFNGIKFSILGCGNSSYEKYNFAAKKVYNRIFQLGGIPISKYLADEQDPLGLYTQYNLWIEDLIKKLSFVEIKSISSSSTSLKNIYEGTILNKEIYMKGEFQDVMNLRIKVAGIKYFPGTVCSFIPLNTNIEEFIVYNKLNDFEDLKILDFNVIPPFNTIKVLYSYVETNRTFHFSDTKRQNIVLEKLKDLSTNYDFYFAFIKMKKISLFQLLKEFKIFVKEDFLIENCHQNIQRYFTLPFVDTDTYELTITLLSKQEYGRKVGSITTNYLKSLVVGSILKIEVFDSFLYFNKNKILIFCTGSGISVARSIWNFFKGSKEILVYYGFRFNKDKLFEEECSKIDNLNVISCPSREGKKMYIQDVFYEEFCDSIYEYDIIVGGSSVLIKEIRKVMEKKFKKDINFMSETW